MIIWGSGGGESILGYKEDESVCAVCDKSSKHSIRVSYRYFHLWYLFSWLTSRDYLEVCSICNNGRVLDKASTKEKYPKDNIPFIRKKGWILFLVVLAFLISLGVMGHYHQSTKVSKIMASPVVNDIYLADLAKIKGSGYDPDTASGDEKKNAYGYMKLIKVDGDTLYFAVSTAGYTKKKNLQKAIKDRNNYVKFMTDYPLVFSKTDFLALHENQIVFDVIR